MNRSAPSVFARLVLIAGMVAVCLAPAWASADVVPPFPCPEGEEWQGAHDGECVACGEGTHWEPYERGQGGHCVEGEAPPAPAPSGGCSAAGEGAGAAWMFGLVALFGRRRR